MASPVVAAGPKDPAVATPARQPGSVRRTTSIDSARPDGPRGDVVVDARGRDIRTERTGTAGASHRDEVRVLGEVALTLRLDGRSHELLDVGVRRLPGEAPDLQSLLGARVGPGFRRRLRDTVPAEHDGGSLVHLLLDDLVGAVLVSGYDLLHADDLPPHAPAVVDGLVARMGDQCAGWALDGGFIAHIRQTGRMPTPHGPPAPPLEPTDDPWAWHAMAPLPVRATRRRRQLDVHPPGPDGLRAVDAHFRDSHRDGDGVETVVHEYRVHGSVDQHRRRIVDLWADPLVLPWTECPSAIGSASRLRGSTFDDLRRLVRHELVGTSSCTHLNDTLRSLADLGALLAYADREHVGHTERVQHAEHSQHAEEP